MFTLSVECDRTVKGVSAGCEKLRSSAKDILKVSYRNLPFILGSLLYILGSFAASTLINEPAYTELLEIDINDQAGITRIRSILNKGNITRGLLKLDSTKQ